MFLNNLAPLIILLNRLRLDCTLFSELCGISAFGRTVALSLGLRSATTNLTAIKRFRSLADFSIQIRFCGLPQNRTSLNRDVKYNLTPGQNKLEKAKTAYSVFLNTQ